MITYANLPFERLGTPISDFEIERTERSLRSKFPADYREFLGKHNGGKPAANVLKVGGELDGDVGLVELYDCETVIRESLQFRQNGLAVIGEAAGANRICLDLHLGCVMFFERSTRTLRSVADTFHDFIYALVTVESIQLPKHKVVSSWIDPAFLKELKSKKTMVSDITCPRSNPNQRV